MKVMSARRALGGILAGDFNDPTNERLIYLSAAGLALIGLGLLFGTLIWWRRGRQEHPALAPLEVMSTRAWENSPEGERRRKLEQVRLSGAAGSVEEPIVAPPVDLEALVRSVPEDFDDLREPSAVIAAPAAAEVVTDEPAEPAAEGEAEAEAAEEGAVEEADASVEAEVAPVEPAAEPAPVEPIVKPEPAKVDVDATSIATERPIVPSESPAKVPADSSE
ncbi:MAG TPA: hypothetical protein VHQ23_11475 [Ilumatobacteraceae bacterium]|nr:hypothetical protein [Ilumatobacteraceae bacterium]